VLVLLAAPLAAEAQQTGKVWRIGLLILGDRPGAMKALVEGLRELNYVEGRNLILEHRRAARNDQLPTLATELVRFNPHVIVAGSGRAASALKAATKTVPIVMASSGDAIAQGLVASLARPGGNVTGFTNIATELAAKRLEILKEGAPRAVRIGVVGCQEESPLSKRQWSEVQPAAQGWGFASCRSSSGSRRSCPERSRGRCGRRSRPSWCSIAPFCRGQKT
jgi:putative ABC transport system substrate-binding protein